MRYTIDRFENGFAVLSDDDGNMRNVPADVMPAGAAEGDIVIAEEADGILCDFRSDIEAGNERKRHIHSLFEKIKNKKDGI